MDKKTIFSGKIISYNGIYGFIASQKEKIFFHKSNVNCPAPLYRGDSVKYEIRPSRKKKGGQEAFNVSIIKHGSIIKNLNNRLKLGNPEVQIGFIKWFDHDKGFGVILNCDNEEYFWISNTDLSNHVDAGNMVIFIGAIKKENKIVKLCRLPQLLEDWDYVRKIPESKSKITIKTPATDFSFRYGRRHTHTTSEVDIKIEASNIILRESNIDFFSDTTILSDLLLFYASHHNTIDISINLFRELFVSKDGFDNLCHDLYNVIKYYNDRQGIEYLIEFVFKYKYQSFESLNYEDRSKLIEKFNLWENGKLTIDSYTIVEFARKIDVGSLVKTCKCLKRKDESKYWQLFDELYDSFSTEERLYLWLNDVNNRYNYAELLQSSSILSFNERKCLNKKIKVHAKEERFLAFLNQIPPAVIIENHKTEIIYKCTWRNLYYNNSGVIVFLNKESALPTFHWSSAREEWNWLTNEYFTRKRIGNIYVYTKNGVITKIEGLENIEERIIIADIQHNGSLNHRSSINGEQVIRIIHNVAARNKCIDFLSRQSSPFNAIDIQELVSNKYGEIKRDISFMFIIPNDTMAYIIWESIEYEKSKATYIFCCNIESGLIQANNIKKYIESNLHIRSRLINNYDDEIKRELHFYARVTHDSSQYEIWEKRMKEVLPFFK